MSKIHIKITAGCLVDEHFFHFDVEIDRKMAKLIGYGKMHELQYNPGYAHFEIFLNDESIFKGRTLDAVESDFSTSKSI